MIDRVETEADVALCVRIGAAVDGAAPAIEQLRRLRERLLLDRDGGYAYVDHSGVAGSAYAMVRVLPARRGAGIGTALLGAAVAAARKLGSDSAWGWVRSGDEASLRFAAAHGFEEVGREVELRRRLTRGEGTIPEGVVELREEHRAGAHAVAVAAIPDMVTAGDAAAAPFDEWVERELARAAAAFVAVERGTVVAYATLQPVGEDDTRLEHGFTGVLPAHRRRGIATALGQAQIAWAARRGYDELFTTTGVANTGLRRQKAKLAYAEQPGPVLVRGPV